MREGVFACCLGLLLLLSPPTFAGQELKAKGASKLAVFATILPQAYFLERIGGRHLQIEVLVGPGQSPHTYEPTPRQMAKLTAARAFFGIGVPLETGLLRKIGKTNPQLTIVETQRGVPLRYLDAHDHGVAEEGRHGHRQAALPREGKTGTPDPHIWMSPRLAKIQARNIHDALCRLDPAHKQEYGAGLRSFLDDLDRVDTRIARALAPLRGGKIYVFHPAFGYFAEAYGMTQVSVEKGGKEPSARQLSSLIAAARKDGVRVIFVQRQFSARSAAAVAAAIGGTVIPIDPLARDYLTNLEKIAAAVERGQS
ncbi:MAG: zinc ABC transporter substrate-binding protein [Syntrophobacterales bacterium]|nr:zinc ABC transporter substrate-binding protein [Syntrophobacterales bacterium]